MGYKAERIINLGMWEISNEKAMVWEKFRSCPYFIVYDFEAILTSFNQNLDYLTY